VPAFSLSELNASVTDELASPQGTTTSLHFASLFPMSRSSTIITGSPLSASSWLARAPILGSCPPAPRCTFRLTTSGPSATTREVWEDKLAFQINDVLDSMCVKWTSMDIVRIGFERESVAPVIVWIGVKLDTLSGKDGFAAAKECKKLLVANDIHDVEVEIRELVVWGSRAGRMVNCP
jgi:hypothetical protein